MYFVIGKSGRSYLTFYGYGPQFFRYGPMKTARVLLVDDNPDSLERLAVLLSEHYAVSSYGSPAEALREADPVTPHVLVLGTRPIFNPRGLVTLIARALDPAPQGNPIASV